MKRKMGISGIVNIFVAIMILLVLLILPIGIKKQPVLFFSVIVFFLIVVASMLLHLLIVMLKSGKLLQQKGLNLGTRMKAPLTERQRFSREVRDQGLLESIQFPKLTNAITFLSLLWVIYSLFVLGYIFFTN